jgi:hypothetical protein
MSRTRSFVLALTAALVSVSAPPSHAASASDAGARVVVPFVEYDKATETLVFVENHEGRAVEVQLRWIGERRSGSPGLRICGRFLLAADSLTSFDLRQSCSLPGTDDLGMLVAMVTNQAGLARISARARVDLLDPVMGLVLQTLMVDGLPLGALDTTDSIHVASGLRHDPTGAAGAPVTTDCFFGTFVDGSGAGGVLARLGLRDRDGQVLGSDIYFALRPFELLRLEDVFKLVGAPSGPFDDVRAAFFPAGGGDAILGYCRTAQTQPTKGARTLALTLAQVADPQDETRRRSVSVNSTPEAQGGAAFALQPAGRRVVHGLFVGHPDRLSCAISSSDALVLKAVSPDGAVTVGGTGSQTGWFDAGPRGQVAGGFSDLWGLEVSWDPGAARTGPVNYTLSCRSGNGVSLADELFRN